MKNAVMTQLLLFFVITITTALQCLQCGGKIFEGDVRISRHYCCNPSPVTCSHGQVCLRAYVVSPETSFFLSGCHTPDDGMIGCDTHQVTGNATSSVVVHRCVCGDERCQGYFKGNCHAKTHKVTTTTPPAITTTTSFVSLQTTRIPAAVSLLHPPRSQPRKHFDESSSFNRLTVFSAPLLVFFVFL